MKKRPWKGRGRSGSELELMLARGLTLAEAAMLTEAIYSCAIEGGRIPKTKKDWDRLCEMVKLERLTNAEH